MNVEQPWPTCSRRVQSRRWRARSATAFFALVVSVSVAHAEEVIPIQSLTMTDEQFLKGDRAAATPVEIRGTLSFPDDVTGAVPAVILLHGSGGPESSGVWNWTKILNRLGVATFAIDSYTGRGFKEIYTYQARVGEFNNIIDSYAAFAALARDPRIDRSSIAVMGFSRGGIAALYSAMTRFQKLYMREDVKFAAHLPFYPPYNFKLDGDLDVADAPIRAFHGDADDWNPVPRCKDYIERLEAAGRDAEIRVYPGARHAFDHPAGPAYNVVDDAQTSRRCMRVEKNGVLYNDDTGKPFSWKDTCVELGPASQFNPAAMDAAEKEVTSFLGSVFALDR